MLYCCMLCSAEEKVSSDFGGVYILTVYLRHSNYDFLYFLVLTVSRGALLIRTIF